MAFKPVSPQVDFPALEREIMKYWDENGILDKYLHKNDNSPKKFSFLDGPITANNPMGVHHAWGRTYKDLWQRYFTLKGFRQRYQNGFDCQGLWIEVEVEKELGFKSKKDIEIYGVAKFVNKCKDRAIKYAAVQTEQSRRLGYFMDWDNSYFTLSDDNNYAIWAFLKECWVRGWLYKGHDVVPWCPRCETAISQHEILTEDYHELTHDSIYLELPIRDKDHEFLLIWTTTPWTLPANTAVAVDPNMKYSLVEGSTGDNFWIATDLVEKVFQGKHRVIKNVSGKQLIGFRYRTPFDDLPLISEAITKYPNQFHCVVATDNQLMPISSEEGTGLVHTSTSTGEEDFRLGKKLDLPVIPAIDDSANYLEGFGQFTGKNAKKFPNLIFDHLKEKEKQGENWIFDIIPYTHRYPACWRCKTELVWKVADEWYIAMDKSDPTHQKKISLRQQMSAMAKKISWLPSFGLDRELDWLKNMHDWLISKKNRYWGLALPIYECVQCGKFEVIGSKKELQTRSIEGWEKFEGNSPHRPWIDEVKVKCLGCGNIVSRISDVGNPWLDAGIVSTSTLPPDWFPADFITESFPGQFKNWFYSLIAMGTVLKKTVPFKSVLGFASACGTDGQIMHKSNPKTYISFDDGADKAGVDVMRWMFTSQNPSQNLIFGFDVASEVRRRFHLILWNIYNFFITYANVDHFDPNSSTKNQKMSVLDKWILARLNETISGVTIALDKYNAYTASQFLESFVSDFSLWYVRRSRDRVGPTAATGQDKVACLQTLYQVLVALSQLLAPFNPFISESIYHNLTGELSVHLTDWPKSQKLNNSDQKLIQDMKTIRKIVEMGLSQRKTAGIKVRQPLRSASIIITENQLDTQLQALILDELNIKTLNFQSGKTLEVKLNLDLDKDLLEEGQTRELIRQVQLIRKEKGARLDQKIKLQGPLPQSPQLLELLRQNTLAVQVESRPDIHIELL